MSYEEQHKAVHDTLRYMIEEGMVVKVGNKYRIKTEAELEREMSDLIYDEYE